MTSVDNKRPLKVFLCHAHADRDAVHALYSRLTKDGVDAWLDKEKLLAGQDWELEIKKAVRKADVVVVCLSKQFNQAGFRQKEVRLALDTAMEKPEGEIFIIPARLEECDNLESLKKWHWVDLFEADGYERLMRALRARADEIGVTLRLKKIWLPKVSSQPETVKKPSLDYEKPVEKKQEKPIPEKKTANTWNKYLVGAILLIALVLAFVFGLPSLTGQPEATSTAVKTNGGTSTPIVFITETPKPSETPSIPTSTESPALTAALTALPTEITDAKGVSMVLVPAGEFMMGSDSGADDEKPVHQVYLDAFYMDIYEVTNVAYKACVTAGGCTPPQNTRSYTRSSYYGNSQYDNYPVIYVDWNQAQAYCEWRDAGLPTEAQWEKAARGTDGRIYPWGEEISCNQANYLVTSYDGSKHCVGDTTEVGSYESGKSPYGMYDMAGNVWEWVADWYDEDYYASSPSSNPLGPSSGQYRMLRGGSWGGYVVITVNSTNRLKYVSPVNLLNNVGFRCAKEAPVDKSEPTLTPISTISVSNTPGIPTSGFDLISIDEVAYRGGTASARIQTQPGTECALGFILPSGDLSQAGGTGPRTADENGYCSWTWEIASNVNPGWGSIYIEAGGESETYPIEIK